MQRHCSTDLSPHYKMNINPFFHDVNSSITFWKAELTLIKSRHAMLQRLKGYVSVLLFKQPIQLPTCLLVY